ncbi:MAG TPA: hypothetical protein VIF82_08775 [Burkholderiaceae bacterium]|jgi:hypothetical protein
MRLISKLRDKLRNLAGIRRERQLPPPGEKPSIGSNIVREKLRIRLKYPITDALWKFLIAQGWRAIDMRYNKRRYTIVPDKVLLKLIKADDLERHVLHARLVKVNKHGSNPYRVSRSDTPALQPLSQNLAFEKNTVE